MASTSTDSIAVLHVDDEPDFTDMAATFVEREDDRFYVETATGPSEALDRLDGERFDCIVSDYDMPRRNGIEFLEAVREDFPDIPFILFTGKGSEEVASDAISAGVTDYLQKGSGTSQYAVLANRIRNAVEKYHAQTELAEREQRLNLFFEQSPLGVVEWDERFDLVRINDAGEDILGYAQDDLVGGSWETIVPESDRDAVAEVVTNLLENKGGYHSINENVRKDGERIVCEWHNRVVTDDDGDVVAIFSQFQDITERRRRQRQFEAVFNNTHTLTGLMEPDGTVIEVNETALSFGGLERDDVVGKRLWDTYWVRSNEHAQSTVREAIERARKGDAFRDEIRIQGSDGDAMIDFSVRPVTDTRGDVILLVPEGRDITERKQQERKREQIIDRVTDAIVEVNANWEFTMANEQAEDLYGLDEEYLLGRNFWDVFSEAKGTRFEEKYRGVMETRAPTSFVEYYSGLDGWFDIQVYPNDDGGIAFYFREVTERRQRSQALERAEKRYRALAENYPDGGVHYFDEELRYQSVSGSGFDTIETSPEDLVGNTIYEVESYSEEIVETLEPMMEATLDGEEAATEVSYEGHNYHLRSVPIRDPDGAVTSGFFIAQDITDQYRRQEELERKNQRLEEFTSIVSHDLRNPLTVVEGKLELAQEECNSDYLDDAIGALTRSQTLIEEMLMLAREGEEVGEVEPVNLADIADGCWQNVSTADATLRIETEQTVQADQSRLRQLLENLVRNAVEHGGSDVTVVVGEMDDGFYIADDGPGVPGDERERVFEAGHSTKSEGSGFGLSIVEQVVTAHDWEIHVTDSEAGGARFEITDVGVVDG
jgi:PAS domain S-box-containing protein